MKAITKAPIRMIINTSADSGARRRQTTRWAAARCRDQPRQLHRRRARHRAGARERAAAHERPKNRNEEAVRRRRCRPTETLRRSSARSMSTTKRCAGDPAAGAVSRRRCSSFHAAPTSFARATSSSAHFPWIDRKGGSIRGQLRRSTRLAFRQSCRCRSCSKPRTHARRAGTWPRV